VSAKRSLTVQESLHTRSFWFLWITWALAGAAGVAMSLLSTAYGLSRGFGLESAILILTAFNLTNGTGRLVSGLLRPQALRGHIWAGLCCLRFCRRTARTSPQRTHPGCDGRQLHPGLPLPRHILLAVRIVHQVGSATPLTIDAHSCGALRREGYGRKDLTLSQIHSARGIHAQNLTSTSTSFAP